ncbi:MAG TPA: YqaJ viral recombinase family protein [Bryobacteraceae bacterium]|nr:YqaJ viral recombinase family protein [Bryobacteraceae bacterium]
MRIEICNDSHWHDLRRNRIGASEVGALFGCGYQTKFELWHEKKGDLEHADYSDNERVVLGRCLEEGIAKAASELYGYNLTKATHYYDDDDCPRLGATPDYFLVRGGGEWPAEVKNASWGAFKDNWIIHEDGFTEPPLRFQLQVQTQLACTRANVGLLIALISGDRIVRCEIPRHHEAIVEIRRRVTEFWRTIEANEEPPAEMPADMDAAKRVWRAGDGNVDLTGDPDVEGWLHQIRELRELKKRTEADADVIEGRILSYCVTNHYAAITANGGRVSCKQREAKPAHTRLFKEQPAKIELRITTR